MEEQELFLAAKALVDKLDEVENSDAYRAIWSLAWVHEYKYTGPQYGKELEHLRKVLEELQSKVD